MLRLVALVASLTASAAVASTGIDWDFPAAPPSCPQALPPSAHTAEDWPDDPPPARLGDRPLPPFVWYRAEDLRPGQVVQCGLRSPEGGCSHNIGLQMTGGSHWMGSRNSDCALLVDPPNPWLMAWENEALRGWWSLVGTPPG